MNSPRVLVTVLYLSVFSSLAAAQPAEACLSYGPAVVKLTGILISKTYPGPPEYQSIRNGDRPETYWLVALRSPVCVNQDKVDPDLDPAHKNISMIQLIIRTQKFYDRHSWLLGKPVAVTGTLIGGTTIHHKTPILLWVQALIQQHPKPKAEHRTAGQLH